MAERDSYVLVQEKTPDGKVRKLYSGVGNMDNWREQQGAKQPNEARITILQYSHSSSSQTKYLRNISTAQPTRDNDYIVREDDIHKLENISPDENKEGWDRPKRQT